MSPLAKNWRTVALAAIELLKADERCEPATAPCRPGVYDFFGPFDGDEIRVGGLPFPGKRLIVGNGTEQLAFVRIQRAYEANGRRYVWFDMVPAEVAP